MTKTNPIPVRLPENLHRLVKEYASFLGISNSEALREVIREGLLRKSYIGLIKRWQEKAKNRDPFTNMVRCEKCGSKEEKLSLYHIDGNVRNLTPENLVILCSGCIACLQKSMRNYNPKEKFAAWFFYEN